MTTMKKNLKYLIVALAGLSLFACNTKADVEPQVEMPAVGGYTYTVAVTGDTKASIDVDHMAWAEGDQIGWFTDKAGYSEINMEANPRTFQVSSEGPLAEGSVVYAYAPYVEAESADAVTLSIPAFQDAVMTDAMPMVSLPIEVSADLTAGAPVGEASFLNLGAVICYNIYTTNADYAGETIQSVAFTADANIAGNFTVDLTAVSAENLPEISGLTDATVVSNTEATPGLTKEEGVVVYQVIAPGTWSGTVTVTTDVATYEYTVDSKVFERAVIKPLNIDLASENAVRALDLQRVERLLYASQWELTAVLEVGNPVTSAVGNKVKLNSDYSMEFDCTANEGKTYDHSWEGGFIDPYVYYEGVEEPMSWCVWEDEGVPYLGVNCGYLLIWLQDGIWWAEYKITELTDTNLTVETVVSWGDTWSLVFEAVNQ